MICPRRADVQELTGSSQTIRRASSCEYRQRSLLGLAQQNRPPGHDETPPCVAARCLKRATRTTRTGRLSCCVDDTCRSCGWTIPDDRGNWAHDHPGDTFIAEPRRTRGRPDDNHPVPTKNDHNKSWRLHTAAQLSTTTVSRRHAVYGRAPAGRSPARGNRATTRAPESRSDRIPAT
jgi:hypothetical protein